MIKTPREADEILSKIIDKALKYDEEYNGDDVNAWRVNSVLYACALAVKDIFTLYTGIITFYVENTRFWNNNFISEKTEEKQIRDEYLFLNSQKMSQIHKVTIQRIQKYKNVFDIPFLCDNRTILNECRLFCKFIDDLIVLIDSSKYFN